MKKIDGKSIFKRIIGGIALSAVILCDGFAMNSTEVQAETQYTQYYSVSDISEDLKSENKTMQSYVEGSNSKGEWRYGSTYDSTGKRTLTLAQKYCFNRLTNTPAEWYNDDATGDVLFTGNGIADNTEYTIDFSNIAEGYHSYNYTPPDGTQIPLAGWENHGLIYAIHHEAFDVTKYDVGSNWGLIDPVNWGRWAVYNGIEFHAATKKIPLLPGEVDTKCYDYANNNFYRDSTCWVAICAVCGNEASLNVYAKRSAVEALPVIEEGQEYVITCPTCGGMEGATSFSHTCKAISANQYTISYEKGTNDPSSYGVTNSGTWYYNFADKYENKEVTEQNKTVAECGFVRPGYTFAGWALEPNGTVVYQPGNSLLRVQRDMNSLSNNASVTLYAVWTPNHSYLKVDANSSLFNGGGTYNGVSVWTSNATPYQVQSSSDGTDPGSANGYKVNSYTIDTSKIKTPTGYKATFQTNGGSAVSSITAPVTFAGYNFITTNTNGFFTESNATYTFGKEDRTVTQADTIQLQYKQGAITLPEATKSNSSFIGWYADSSFTTYVGTAGDSYTLTGNITLYARFSTLEVAVTDVYYKKNTGSSFSNVARDSFGKADNDYSIPGSTLAVQGAKGATNISMQMFTPNSWQTIYKPYWKKTGATSWNVLNVDGVNTSASNSSYDKTITSKGTTTYTVQSTGLYKIDAYGAQGGNYGSNSGGLGGETYGVFYLEKGEVITVTVGGQDGTNGGGTATMFANGGGATVVTSNKNGTLLIAGGGGGATSSGAGGSGGSSASLLATGINGESGMAGGGGGYQGGKAGEYIIHTHTDDCYQSDDLSYTLLDKENSYLNEWMQTYQGSWTLGQGTVGAPCMGLWNTHSNSFSIYGVYAHSKENPWSARYVLGAVENGVNYGAPSWSTNYIPTNGNTTVEYTIRYFVWGGGGLLSEDNSFLQIYDQNNNLLFSQTLAQNMEGTSSSNGSSWEDDSGWHGTPSVVDAYFSGSLALPEGTTGIYFYMYEKGNGDAWLSIDVQKVSFSGGENKYTVCGYEEGQILSSKPAYGGSNYINTSAVQANTTGSLSGQKSGNGQVSITGVAINLQDGTDNYVEILGASTPDYAAPGSVGELQADDTGSRLVVGWNQPKSNGTSYDFKVEMYKLPTSGSSLQLVQTSDVVTRVMESAIAGYYYIYDNSASTNVASYINARYTKPSYTWSNQHYSDANTGFTQSTSLAINSSCSYVHIAAVDVAGNIGTTSTREVARTNLCRITFNTNHLKYQINPESTVNCGSWSAAGKTDSVTATGENKQGVYYRGYYAVDGTDIANNGRGTFNGTTIGLSFGGNFPTPSASGCIFVGWNTEPDGSGIYYSASGSNIGFSGITDKKLVLSDITGSHACGQEITLYAIWADVADGTDLNSMKSDDIQKTYQKPLLNESTGVSALGDQPITETITVTTSDETDAVWSTEASVKSRAQFAASGVYTMNHHLFTLAGNRVATIDYYMAGIGENGIGDYTLQSITTTTDALGKPVWIRNGDEKVTMLTSNGSTALLPNSMYDSSVKTLNVNYNIQGSYKVYGTAVSRSYAADNLVNVGQQSYPGYTITQELTLKVDSTIPHITHYSVKQDGLENYTVEEMSEAISKGLLTVFKADVSDYNDVSNGVYYSASDSSGIQGVYVAIHDINNTENAKIYKLALTNKTATTDYDNHVLSGHYELSVNLYAEFPEASTLMYRIYAVDNAGNVSDTLDQFTITKPDGTTEDGIPEGDVDTDLDKPTEGIGILQNFSIKTVIYNDESDVYNVAEGETYFQVGDIGHVEVWTIGYTESVQLNFGEMGEEAKAEISSGNLQKMYHMGLLEEDWTRIISWEHSEKMIPNSFTVYDETTASFVEVTQESDAELFASLLTNEDGVPYAQHYSTAGWGDEGMSVRIPPYYKLTPDGDKVNADGTPQYKWELWRYAVTAQKKSGNATSTSEYILWDTRANDVHYRVTHES